MEASDKSEIKIKEKLNLHVKKRLQESTKNSTADKNDLKEKNNASSAGTSSSVPRTKRQKTRIVPKATTSVSGTISANSSIKSSDLLLSPGAANSNDTTNSSINSTDQDGELNDRDAGDQAGSSDKPAKSAQRMDIFSCLLNQKKTSLMRDPEVIAFLNSLIEGKK